MREALDAWQTFDRVWRSVFASVWRLPLLLVGCPLFYTALSAFWLHYFPINISGYFPVQTGYCLLHAICFTPLVMAMMTLILDGRVVRDTLWSSAALRVALALFAYDELGLLVAELVDATRFGPLEALSLAQYRQGHTIPALILFDGLKWVLKVAFFMLSVRLILFLPMLTHDVPVLKALARAWDVMQGHYCFALCVTVFSVLPFLVADFFIMRQYRVTGISGGLPVGLSLYQWGALLIRAADLTLRFLFYASLVAWLYRAIDVRKPTAP